MAGDQLPERVTVVRVDGTPPERGTTAVLERGMTAALEEKVPERVIAVRVDGRPAAPERVIVALVEGTPPERVIAGPVEETAPERVGATVPDGKLRAADCLTGDTVVPAPLRELSWVDLLAVPQGWFAATLSPCRCPCPFPCPEPLACIPPE
jgi:hypothetical protein